MANAKVHEIQITHAQSMWANGVIEMSKALSCGGIDQARSIAEQWIDRTYDFEHGPVLFKPTTARGRQSFRHTKRGAIAYFIGHDADFPNDVGLAATPWEKIAFGGSAYAREGATLLWMGQAFLSAPNRPELVVNKSLVYRHTQDGQLRIILHHSSLPQRG